VSVNSGGTFAPGNSAGLLALSGNLTLASGSVTSMGIGGTTRGTLYDAANVTGTITFGGTLNVSFVSGYTPSGGESFDLFDWSAKSGTFSSVNLPSLPGLSWDTSALYTTGVISAIPEPSTWAALAGAGALGLAAWRRKRALPRVS
jgi:hypothetical protein